MVALILAIVGILLFFVSDILGLILTGIAFFLAKKGKEKNEKYTKEAYTLSKVAIIIQVVLIIIGLIYTVVTVSSINEEANNKAQEIINRLDDYEYSE